MIKLTAAVSKASTHSYNGLSVQNNDTTCTMQYQYVCCLTTARLKEYTKGNKNLLKVITDEFSSVIEMK